ncbi:hypothetical protein P3X46_034991 [Hevea brasiliensis]|uniref:Uncharacterized protein n=1 Tax=Hevea brasiliensis TaxID=3981 RepID=A0ABQ9K8I3_HEVBR|nr:hypothetical protein P3X46_034991 [Hevea brasiliensis]
MMRRQNWVGSKLLDHVPTVEEKFKPWMLKENGVSAFYPFVTRSRESIFALYVPGDWNYITRKPWSSRRAIAGALPIQEIRTFYGDNFRTVCFILFFEFVLYCKYFVKLLIYPFQVTSISCVLNFWVLV